jgi:uncharacterized protein
LTKVLHINALYIYPIKSVAGISVPSIEVLPTGFKYDRHWMIVDEKGEMLTQRTSSTMSMLRQSLHGDTITISHGDNTISFAIHENTNRQLVVKVWDDEAQVVQVSHAVDTWLSAVLNKTVSLVKLRDLEARIHHSSAIDVSFHTTLADGYPCLSIGTASIDKLNSLLPYQIDERRFRPNMVINTDTPHEEDTWHSLQINNLKFINAKPCARCVMITIDPDAGSKDVEIMKQLNTYRKVGNNILFGSNILTFDSGIISVGDEVVV